MRERVYGGGQIKQSAPRGFFFPLLRVTVARINYAPVLFKCVFHELRKRGVKIFRFFERVGKLGQLFRHNGV